MTSPVLSPTDPGQIRLAPQVRDVMADVDIDSSGTRATFRSESIVADTPREMKRLLAEAIYNLAHAGQPHGVVPSRLRDRDREVLLREAVPHTQVSVPVTFLQRVTDDDGPARVLLEREGVRFWAPESVLGDDDPAAGAATQAALPPTRPGLSPGFFLVDGSRPAPRGVPVVRTYVHIGEADDAVAIWRTAISLLEERGVRYRAKILTAAEIYPRRDAFVVYLHDTDALQQAAELAAALRDVPGLRPDTSAFAEQIAPGVAIAWEPDDQQPGMGGLSFGQHRATVVANAAVDTAEAPAQRYAALTTQLEQAGVDPMRPARNLAPSAADLGSLDVEPPPASDAGDPQTS